MSEHIGTNDRGEKWFSFGYIFSIQKTKKGFQFAEECDYWHKQTVSKKEANKILNAALDYVNGNEFGAIPDFTDDN